MNLFIRSIVLIMLLALTGIAIHNYRTMRSDTLALSEGVITNLQSRIETEVHAYISRMARIINLSHDLLADEL